MDLLEDFAKLNIHGNPFEINNFISILNNMNDKSDEMRDHILQQIYKFHRKITMKPDKHGRALSETYYQKIYERLEEYIKSILPEGWSIYHFDFEFSDGGGLIIKRNDGLYNFYDSEVIGIYQADDEFNEEHGTLGEEDMQYIRFIKFSPTTQD